MIWYDMIWRQVMPSLEMWHGWIMLDLRHFFLIWVVLQHWCAKMRWDALSCSICRGSVSATECQVSLEKAESSRVFQCAQSGCSDGVVMVELNKKGTYIHITYYILLILVVLLWSIASFLLFFARAWRAWQCQPQCHCQGPTLLYLACQSTQVNRSFKMQIKVLLRSSCSILKQLLSSFHQMSHYISTYINHFSAGSVFPIHVQHLGIQAFAGSQVGSHENSTTIQDPVHPDFNNAALDYWRR